MKHILINGTHKEEKRVAFLVNKQLYDIDIEPVDSVRFKSNIYLGKISRVEPSLDAAFVNYGAERHGFLPFKELHPGLTGPRDQSNSKITDVLREGQTICIQIEKEERGSKGAALTTFIALAGKYLVFLPNSHTAGGISRKLSNEDRDSMKEILQQMDIPNNSSVIIRTAGVGQNIEDISSDLDYLKQLWQAIDSASSSATAPKLLYQDSNFINRIIRDYAHKDVDEIITDTQELHEECKSMIIQTIPELVDKVTYYEDRLIPLFSKYKVEGQIETAYQHEVQLPSGGSITIDYTEALVSIDINSSKSTKGGDIEETALHTNMEASAEIARQLRLRDIGGLIVIDFIDMGPTKNIRQVETSLKTALRHDRARIQIGRISRFGLLEMSRQRLKASLSETSTSTCPKCQGQGFVRTTESLSLSIFRLMIEQALRERTVQVRVRLPLAVATYLLNEKREDFSNIELSFSVSIIILPVPEMQAPNYELVWVQESGKTESFSSQDDLEDTNMDTENKLRNKALSKMKPLVHGEPPARSTHQGLFAKFLASLGLKPAPEPEQAKVQINTNERKKRYRGRSGNRNRNNRNRYTSRRSRSQTQKSEQEA